MPARFLEILTLNGSILLAGALLTTGCGHRKGTMPSREDLMRAQGISAGDPRRTAHLHNDSECPQMIEGRWTVRGIDTTPAFVLTRNAARVLMLNAYADITPDAHPVDGVERKTPAGIFQAYCSHGFLYFHYLATDDSRESTQTYSTVLNDKTLTGGHLSIAYREGKRDKPSLDSSSFPTDKIQ